MRASKGMWRSSKRKESIAICEMSDRHLTNACLYMRLASIRWGRDKTERASHVDKLLELVFEAGQRQLQIDWSRPPPDPKLFQGQEYERRTPKPNPLVSRPRAVRTIDC